MRLLTLLLLLVAGAAQAAPVVICDPADELVPHRVKRWRARAHTPAFEGRNDVLIAPSPGVRDFEEPPRHLKCEGGNGVETPYTGLVVMTAQEIAAVDEDDAGPAWAELPVKVGRPADRPACEARTRSWLWVARMPPGTADKCFVCILGTEPGSFAWAELQLASP